MKINQKILKKKNIFEIIEKIIHNPEYNIDYRIFYPSKIDWYKYNIQILEKIIKENKDKFKTFIYYKNNGYIIINNILINKSFPLIYKYNNYNSNIQNIFKKNIINKDPTYIFPNDIQKISNYKEKKILNYINNIDYIFNNYYNDIELSDCILFRGMNINNNNIINSHDIFYEMTQTHEYKIKKNEIPNKIDEEFTFDNYISTSFNIKTALSFIKRYSNNNILLILNIKKEHKIPGLFLSNRFFYNSLNNLNKNIEKKIVEHDESEFEILINRNFKIKILKIKNIKINNKKIYHSIQDIYKNNNDKINDNTKFRKIKLIFAESCPYIFPNSFVPQNKFQYLCYRL
jgi:hypothetical protein